MRIDDAKSRLYNQFHDKPNLEAALELLASGFDDIDDALLYLGSLDVYTAQGVWLDLIGTIVGQGRRIETPIAVEFFGFQETAGGLGFGQARFRTNADRITETTLLADPEYLKAILARVAKNGGDISKIGTVNALQIILDTPNIYVRNAGNAKITISIGKALTSTEKNLIDALDIVPAGAGIGVEYRSAYDPAATFGFANSTLGFKGFGQGSFAKKF